MNTLTLLIIWILLYPVTYELFKLLHSVRMVMDEKKTPTRDDDYRSSMVYTAVYIIGIIFLILNL